MGKIRVGVVGVGYLGQFHAEKYAKMKGVELVGVADVVPSRAEEVARRYHTQPFLHYSDLFRKVQAVSVAVPTPLHHSITRDFFLHGIDVLLEKPMTKTLDEASRLTRLAESRGLILQVGHLERFNGALAALKGLVHDPWFIESYRLSPFPGRGTDVSVVLDLMIHDIDILLSLVKSRVRQVRAAGVSILTPHTDVAHAWIEFESGCIAHLTSNRVSEEKVRRTRIFQSKGILSVDFLAQRASLSEKTVSERVKGGPSVMAKELPVKRTDSLEAEIRAFLLSVKTRRDICIPGGEGKQALEVALRIVRKIEETTLRGKGGGRRLNG